MDPEWERVKEILAAALELPPAERDAFVKSRCAGDEALERAVFELLVHATATAKDPLERGAMPGLLDPLGDIKPGVEIGEYIVIDRIGRGGMGQVFLARDGGLRRRVALKCLLSSATDAGADRAAILQEARNAAAINHPNVAAIYHVIEHHERAFMVMEYVDGETLADKIGRGRIPSDRVVAIGRQLAKALQEAHSKGIIHRDIKPGNIQVTHDGSIKVLDFGVARSLRVATSVGSTAATTGDVSPELPQTLNIVGTPPYMAPEQLRGARVDERADIFSLGVVMFEMTAGQRPFKGRTAEEVRASQMAGAPNLEAIDSRLSISLCEVIRQCLALDAGSRFQTAAAVDIALDDVEREVVAQNSGAIELLLRRLARVSAGLALSLIGIELLGVITCRVYDQFLGRIGRYSSDTWGSYFVAGLRSMVAPAMLLILFSVGGWVLFEVVTRLVRWLRRRTVGTWLRASQAYSVYRQLQDPAVFARLAALTGAIALALCIWSFSELIKNFTSYVDTAPTESLALLNPSLRMGLRFRFWLALINLSMGAAVVVVVRLHKRRPNPQMLSGLVATIGVLMIGVVLNDVPYRLFNDTSLPKVDFGGVRGYVTGEDGDQLLVYLPDLEPPRNHTISRRDEHLKFTGVSESIFTPRH